MKKEELRFSVEKSEVLYDFVLTAADNMQRPHSYRGKNMSMVCAHSLVRIAKNPGIKVGDLAVMWGHTRGAATRNAERLAGLGLVIRKKEEGNNKEVRLYPTPRGERFAREHTRRDRRTIGRITEKALRNHSFEELKTFFSVMEDLKEILKGETL